MRESKTKNIFQFSFFFFSLLFYSASYFASFLMFLPILYCVGNDDADDNDDDDADDGGGEAGTYFPHATRKQKLKKTKKKPFRLKWENFSPSYGFCRLIYLSSNTHSGITSISLGNMYK